MQFLIKHTSDVEDIRKKNSTVLSSLTIQTLQTESVSRKTSSRSNISLLLVKSGGLSHYDKGAKALGNTQEAFNGEKKIVIYEEKR